MDANFGISDLAVERFGLIALAVVAIGAAIGVAYLAGYRANPHTLEAGCERVRSGAMLMGLNADKVEADCLGTSGTYPGGWARPR